MISSSSSAEEPSPYELCVRRLYETNLFHPVKMGLDNIQTLYQALGRPLDHDDDAVVIHIAGTNGKGSVAYKIAQALRYPPNEEDTSSSSSSTSTSNTSIALFTSPHIASFRERMQINGQPIPEETVVALLPTVYEHCERLDVPATFFELTTALAMAYFRDCDAVVLETGLGGRLDATNVVERPALAVITSIGLEHTRILGDTIELIAREKAGIMKRNCPVLVGPNVPLDVMRECAKDKGVSQLYTCEDVLGPAEGTVDTDDYDAENARIARAALHLLRETQPQNSAVAGLSEESIVQGIGQRPPCRFEVLTTTTPQRRVVLDVAHNPPAMDYLVRKLTTTFPPKTLFRFVVGLSADKDLSLCAQSLLQATQNDPSRIHLVQAAHPRAATLERLLQVFPNGVHANVDNRSVEHQIQVAAAGQNNSSDNDEVLVVCGSVFLMAEAREALGIDEPRDSAFIAEMAGAGVRYAQENFGKEDKGTPASS